MHRHQSEIEKILRSAGLGPGVWARTAQIATRAAAAEDGGLDWVLTTELPVTVFDWDRWEFVNEVLLADGMLVPASGQVPLLDSHNRNRCADVLGHVRDFAEGEVAGYAARTGRAFFAADDYSQTVRQKVLDGHLTDGSVGYRVDRAVWIPEGTEAAVNGRIFTGPIKVSYQWSLKEYSPTPIGADVLAKVRMLCGS